MKKEKKKSCRPNKKNYLFINLVCRGSIIVVGSRRATILCNVARAATIVADHSVGNVGLVGTLPSFVSSSTAVRAAWTKFAFTECSVKHSQFTKLHFAKIILVFWYFNCFFDDFAYLLKDIFIRSNVNLKYLISF